MEINDMMILEELRQSITVYALFLVAAMTVQNLCIGGAVWLSAKSRSISSSALYGAVTALFGSVPAIAYLCIMKKASRPEIDNPNSTRQKSWAIALLVIGIVISIALAAAGVAVYVSSLLGTIRASAAY